jgi:anthranilate phosphoribosyltransferase
VFSQQLQRTIAQVLKLIGAKHVLVVHSNGLA